MSHCNEFIRKIREILPDPCTVKDLVKVGIFRTPQSARGVRMSGIGPSHFKLGKRILYPKDGIIEWLIKGKKEEVSEECSLDDK